MVAMMETALVLIYACPATLYSEVISKYLLYYYLYLFHNLANIA